MTITTFSSFVCLRKDIVSIVPGVSRCTLSLPFPTFKDSQLFPRLRLRLRRRQMSNFSVCAVCCNRRGGGGGKAEDIYCLGATKQQALEGVIYTYRRCRLNATGGGEEKIGRKGRRGKKKHPAYGERMMEGASEGENGKKRERSRWRTYIPYPHPRPP